MLADTLKRPNAFIKLKRSDSAVDTNEYENTFANLLIQVDQIFICEFYPTM